jgi:hypothetical protein
MVYFLLAKKHRTSYYRNMDTKTDPTAEITPVNHYERTRVRIWSVSLTRLRRLKTETGVDVVRLIDMGSKLLEKKYQKASLRDKD